MTLKQALEESARSLIDLKERISSLTSDLEKEQAVYARLTELDASTNGTASVRPLTVRTAAKHGGVFANIRPVIAAMPRDTTFSVQDIRRTLRRTRGLDVMGATVGYILREQVQDGTLRRLRRGVYQHAK